MFNIGGGEVVVIALLALIVLGPQRLPGAARQAGRALSELRRLSSGFQRELREAFDEAERGTTSGTASVSAGPAPDVTHAVAAVSTHAPAGTDDDGSAARATTRKPSTTRKAAGKKASTPTRKAAAKKAPTRKAAAKKTPTRKAAATKASAKTATPAKAASKRAPATKRTTTARKAPARSRSTPRRRS